MWFNREKKKKRSHSAQTQTLSYPHGYIVHVWCAGESPQEGGAQNHTYIQKMADLPLICNRYLRKWLCVAIPEPRSSQGKNWCWSTCNWFLSLILFFSRAHTSQRLIGSVIKMLHCFNNLITLISTSYLLSRAELSPHASFTTLESRARHLGGIYMFVYLFNKTSWINRPTPWCTCTPPHAIW